MDDRDLKFAYELQLNELIEFISNLKKNQSSSEEFRKCVNQLRNHYNSYVEKFGESDLDFDVRKILEEEGNCDNQENGENLSENINSPPVILFLVIYPPGNENVIRYKYKSNCSFLKAFKHFTDSHGVSINDYEFVRQNDGKVLLDSKNPMDYGMNIENKDYSIKMIRKSFAVNKIRLYLFKNRSLISKIAVKPEDPLIYLFDYFKTLHSTKNISYVYLYNGFVLSGNSSPASLGISDRSKIDVMEESEYLAMKQRREMETSLHKGNQESRDMLQKNISYDSVKGGMPFPSSGNEMGFGNYNNSLDNEYLLPMASGSWNFIDDKQMEEKLHQIFDTLDHCENLTAEKSLPTPSLMTVELKEYQKIGVTWMLQMEESKNGGFLCDEMGLGKTVQMIAVILRTLDACPAAGSSDFRSLFSKNKKTTLIIVPLSLMVQWRDEINRLIKPGSKLRCLLYHGEYLTPKERKRYDNDPLLFHDYDVVLSTYATLTTSFNLDKDNKAKYFSDDFHLDRNSCGPLFRVKWHRCVLDEAHCIKNRFSVSSIAVSFIEAQKRWCLTGTPIQNTSDDVYSLMRFIKLDPYSNWTCFKNDLSVAAQRNKSGSYAEMKLTQKLEKLQTVLRCVILRRTKNTKIPGTDLPIISLPPKEINVDSPEFSNDERAWYDALEKHNIRRFEVLMQNLGANYTNILVLIMRMRQMCLHHHLVTNGQNIEEVNEEEKGDIDVAISKITPEVLKRVGRIIENENEEFDCSICLDIPTNPIMPICGHVHCKECILEHISSKEMQDDGNPPKCPQCNMVINRKSLVPLNMLFKKDEEIEKEEVEDSLPKNKEKEWQKSTKIRRLIELLTQTPKGEKTIVFCSFTKMLDIIEPALIEHGITFSRLDGSMNLTTRVNQIDKLNNDKSVTVLLASLKCSSVGLNLTVANHCILLDVWWNPAIENQAIDRIHRLGQMAEKVIVHKITIPNTIEDRIMNLQKMKQDLADSALGEGGVQKPRRLSRNQLIYLFRGGQVPRN